jgi:vacuolar-type H+-ATPase subunit H
LHAETAAAGIRADAEREAEDQLQRARKEADALLAKAREENELLREEAAGLETLRSELRTTYRAFLLAALELIRRRQVTVRQRDLFGPIVLETMA